MTSFSLAVISFILVFTFSFCEYNTLKMLYLVYRFHICLSAYRSSYISRYHSSPWQLFRRKLSQTANSYCVKACMQADQTNWLYKRPCITIPYEYIVIKIVKFFVHTYHIIIISCDIVRKNYYRGETRPISIGLKCLGTFLLSGFYCRICIHHFCCPAVNKAL